MHRGLVAETRHLQNQSKKKDGPVWPTSRRMRKFEPYVRRLENLAQEVLSNPFASRIRGTEVGSALNGEPLKVVRKEISLHTQRSTGTFFSGPAVVERLAQLLGPNPNRLYSFDPSCGVGDLLLLEARFLPLLGTYAETLTLWGEMLAGTDLHVEFIKATKARLVLSLVSRAPHLSPAPSLQIESLFPGIEVGNGLASRKHKDASRILLNPPYSLRDAPKSCTWATGKVTAAALFVEHCLNQAAPGTTIVAILPDVLRSGSRYEKWRKYVEANASIDAVDVFGQFDPSTDVSVFLLKLTVRDSSLTVEPEAVWTPAKPGIRTVSDLFDVSVGSVVPYRDAQEGKEYRYIQPKGLPKWEIVRSNPEVRRYNGTSVQPPFVVIRRNSRYEDEDRASATIVAGKGRVVVENHLLVLKPKDNRLKTCKELLKVLRHPDTNSWLNARIRCRHLTVSSVGEIPYNDSIL